MSETLNFLQVHERQNYYDSCVCHLCGKKMRNRFSLKNHVAFVHEKRSNHKCDFCPEGTEVPLYGSSVVLWHLFLFLGLIVGAVFCLGFFLSHCDRKIVKK